MCQLAGPQALYGRNLANPDLDTLCSQMMTILDLAPSRYLCHTVGIGELVF